MAGANALIAFALVGVLAIIIAMEFGELGSIMPHAKGASFSFIFEAFGSEMGFITGILLYFSFSTAIAAIALGFGSYLGSLTGLHSGYYSIIFAIILIFVLSILNIIGIKKAASADFYLVMIKLGILTIFVISAVVLAYSTKTLNVSNFTVPPSKDNVYAIFSASIAVFLHILDFSQYLH